MSNASWEPDALYTQTEVNYYYQSSNMLGAYRKVFPHHRWHSNITPWYSGSLDMELYIASLAGMKEGMKVLDFGCGAGTAVCDFAREIGAIARGLNISESQVAIGGEIARSENLDRLVDFDCYDGFRFPYQDNTFDIVTYFESPVAVPHKRELFKEIFRVLKPGGKLCGDDWIITEKVTPDIYRVYIEPICHSYAVPSIVSIEHYINYMKEAGFNIIKALDLRTMQSSMLSYSFAATSEKQNSRLQEVKRISREIAAKNALYEEVCEDPSLFRSNLPVLDSIAVGEKVAELMMQVGGVHLGRAVQHEYFSLGIFLAQKT